MKAVGKGGKVFDTEPTECFEEMYKVALKYPPRDAGNAALSIAVWAACWMSETLPEAIGKVRETTSIMEHGARNSFGPIMDTKLWVQPDPDVVDKHRK